MSEDQAPQAPLPTTAAAMYVLWVFFFGGLVIGLIILLTAGAVSSSDPDGAGTLVPWGIAFFVFGLVSWIAALAARAVIHRVDQWFLIMRGDVRDQAE